MFFWIFLLKKAFFGKKIIFYKVWPEIFEVEAYFDMKVLQIWPFAIQDAELKRFDNLTETYRDSAFPSIFLFYK